MLEKIYRFYFPAISSQERFSIKQTLYLFLRICATATLLHGLLIVYFGGISDERLIYNGLILLTTLVCWYLAHIGFIRQSSLIFLILIWAIISGIIINQQGLKSNAVEGLLLIIVAASLLLGVRYGFIFSVLSLLTLSFVLWLETKNFLIPNEAYLASYEWASAIIYIALTWVLMAIAIRNLRKAIKTSYFELQEKEKNERELEEQAEYLSALHETTLTIINRLELSPLLESILNRGEVIAKSENGYIDMVSPNQEEMVLTIGHGIFTNAVGKISNPKTGLSHQIKIHKKVIVVDDYNTWEFASPSYINSGFYAILGIPLISNHNLVGVIGVAKTNPDEKFTETEIERLTQFGELASLALSNAELYQAAQAELAIRIETETALRNSEANLNLAMNAGNMATWNWDAASNQLFWSEKTSLILNLNPEQLGNTFDDFIEFVYAADKQKIMRRFQNTLDDQGDSFFVQFRTVDKDNQVHWVEINGKVFVNEDNIVSNVAGTIIDVTSRIKAEQEIKQANNRLKNYTEMLERRTTQFQLAADVARAASELLNPDELIQTMVDLVCERFNLYYVGLFLTDESKEWAILTAGTGEAGKTLINNQHRLEVGNTSMVGWCILNQQPRIALDVGAEAVRFNNPILSQTRSELALPLIARNDAIGALTIQSEKEAAFSKEDIVAFQTMADQLANAILNARLYKQLQKELEERKQIEAEIRKLNSELEDRVRERTADLAATEETFRALAENNPLQITRYDASGRYMYINRIATGETLTKEDVLGKTIREVIGDAPVVDYAEKCIKQVFETGQPMQTEYEIGDFTAAWWLAPEFDSQGKVVTIISTTMNISDRKRMEEELRQRTHELQTSNRELEAFSYSVSHDLRAPLRAIDGFSRILEEDFAQEVSPDAKSHLERIRQSTQQMGNLIEDLLRLSKISRTELRVNPVDLSAMAAEISDLIKANYPQLEMRVNIHPNMTVLADERILRVAIENLINNAWKFSINSPAPSVEIGNKILDGQTTYFIADHGVGFDMAYANKLFGAFQRLHTDEFPGSGIGLAIVQRVIHRHGGHIWAEAEPNKGATFYFTLPED